MPTYEYACAACAHRIDVLHGVHDDGPAACPSCGAEGTMRKAFAPPTIVFKGTGWAKKERRSTAGNGTRKETGDGGSAGDGAAAKDGAVRPDAPDKGSGSDKGSRSGDGSRTGADRAGASAGPSKAKGEASGGSAD